MVFAVVDSHNAAADDLKAISLHDNRRRLVDPQAEQLGLVVDDVDEVIGCRRVSRCWSMATPRKYPNPCSYPGAIMS